MNQSTRNALNYVLGQASQEELTEGELRAAEKLKKNLSAEAPVSEQDLQRVLTNVRAAGRQKQVTTEKKATKKPILLWAPLAAAAAVAVVVIVGIQKEEPVDITVGGSQVSLAKKPYSHRASTAQKSQITKEVKLEYTNVQGLTAKKSDDSLKLAVTGCQCKFSFQKGEIRNLTIRSPRAEYQVVGTVFTLDITPEKDVLIVIEGKVKVVHKGKEKVVEAKQKWDESAPEEVQPVSQEPTNKDKVEAPTPKRDNTRYFTRGWAPGTEILVTLKNKTRLAARLQGEKRDILMIEVGDRSLKLSKSDVETVIKK